jgi:hypothetical protein
MKRASLLVFGFVLCMGVSGVLAASAVPGASLSAPGTVPLGDAFSRRCLTTADGSDSMRS